MNTITPEVMEADSKAALAIERAKGVPIPQGRDYETTYRIGFCAGAQWAVRQDQGGSMKHEIKHRSTGAVLFSHDCDSWKICAEAATAAKANLVGADLVGADLVGADLRGAEGAGLAIAMTRILPDGDLIGWKKCRGDVIVKLKIPVEAKRSSAFGRKCRAEYADVLEVSGAEFGIGQHDGKTKYVVGERVIPDKWDDNWQEECSHGIHFYITRLEAENHA